MCSRARLRNVWMSDRNAPAISLHRAAACRGSRRRLALAGGVFRLDVGLRAVVLRLGFLLAGVLLLAFLRVALLLRDLVLVLGLGFGDLALVRLGGLVLLLELGLGDSFLALGVGLAGFLLVALHRIALRLLGFVVGLDAVFLGLLRLAVDLRLGVGGAVGARADARLIGGGRGGGGLRLGGAREGERHCGGDARQL